MRSTAAELLLSKRRHTFDFTRSVGATLPSLVGLRHEHKFTESPTTSLQRPPNRAHQGDVHVGKVTRRTGKNVEENITHALLEEFCSGGILSDTREGIVYTGTFLDREAEWERAGRCDRVTIVLQCTRSIVVERVEDS